jgi:uncharacterized protein
VSPINTLRQSPLAVRVVPFALFVLLTAGQGPLGETSRFWVYCAKTVVGAGLLWIMWPAVREMRWRISGAAVLVGVAVFILWVGLNPFYPRLLTPGEPWNPHAQFGEGTALAWSVVGLRLLGSSLVVPPLEEVFFRSFVYRYLASPDFQSVPLNRFAWMPFLVTSVVFGLNHHEWLAGILCGFAYQGLVIWKGRLGDAITAHAITNALLGGYVVWQGAWQFW